jgi:hypothetical protein
MTKRDERRVGARWTVLRAESPGLIDLETCKTLGAIEGHVTSHVLMLSPVAEHR